MEQVIDIQKAAVKKACNGDAKAQAWLYDQYSKAMFNKHLNGLFKRILKNPGYIRIVFMSLLKLGLVIKARRKEIKECVVSDEAVFQKYQ